MEYRPILFRRIVQIGTLSSAVLLLFMLTKPFVVAFFAAGVFAAATMPLYRYFEKFFAGEHVRTSVTVTTFILLIMIPIILLLWTGARQAVRLVDYLNENPQVLINFYYGQPNEKGEYVVGEDGETMSLQEISQTEGQFVVSDTLASVESFFSSNGTKVATLLSQSFLQLFMMVYGMYYFILERKKICKFLDKHMPFIPESRKKIVDSFVQSSQSLVSMLMISGGVQTLVSMLLFLLIGLPSALLWTVVLFVTTVFPFVGCNLILVPVGVYVLMQGVVWKIVVFLLVFCFINVIDNFIKSKLFGDRNQLHPAMIFVSIIGGTFLFGPGGLVLGPVSVAVAYTVFMVSFDALFGQEPISNK